MDIFCLRWLFDLKVIDIPPCLRILICRLCQGKVISFDRSSIFQLLQVLSGFGGLLELKLIDFIPWVETRESKSSFNTDKFLYLNSFFSIIIGLIQSINELIKTFDFWVILCLNAYQLHSCLEILMVEKCQCFQFWLVTIFKIVFLKVLIDFFLPRLSPKLYLCLNIELKILTLHPCSGILMNSNCQKVCC